MSARTRDETLELRRKIKLIRDELPEKYEKDVKAFLKYSKKTTDPIPWLDWFELNHLNDRWLELARKQKAKTRPRPKTPRTTRRAPQTPSAPPAPVTPQTIENPRNKLLEERRRINQRLNQPGPSKATEDEKRLKKRLAEINGILERGQRYEEPDEPDIEPDIEPLTNAVASFRAYIPIDGINRRPIRLSEVVNWGECRKTILKAKFCENIKRVMNGVSKRSLSGYSKLVSVVRLLTLESVLNRYDYIPQSAQHLEMFRLIQDAEMFKKNEIDIQGTLKPAYLVPPLRFNNIVRPIVGQADALDDEHVYKVYNLFGRQMNVPKSGLDENQNFNYDLEKYKIPRKQLFEVVFLMAIYKRKKAYVHSFFETGSVLDVVKHLLTSEFFEGGKVYKPWFDYKEDTVNTIVFQPRRVLRRALFTAVAERYKKKIVRWKPARTFGSNTPERKLYDLVEQALNNRYDEFIRRWGSDGDAGETVLQVANNESIAGEDEEELEEDNSTVNTVERVSPLYQLETADEVFTPQAFERILMKVMTDTVQFTEVELNVKKAAADARSAFFTKSFRNMKMGTIERVRGDEFKVRWDVPEDLRDGADQIPLRWYTYDNLKTKNRQVAGYILSKLARKKKPLEFAEGEDVVSELRKGGRVEYGQIELAVGVEADRVRFELDLSDVFDEVEGMIKRFINIISSLPTKDCKTQLVDEINELMKDFDNFFEANGKCQTKYCNVEFEV